MNMHKKRIARRGAAFVCAFGVALTAMPVHAAEGKSLESQKNKGIWVLAIIGAVAAVAGIAYAVYRFFTPDYLEEFEDDFDDDFDDYFSDAWRHHFRFLVITRKSSMKR